MHHAIEQASHLLPAQGPITVYITHNTLHAFESLTFENAVCKGVATFGCEPFLTEDRFRRELSRGRIRIEDLIAVVKDDLGAAADDSLAGLSTRLELRLAMLQNSVEAPAPAELEWYLAESESLRRMRSDISSASRIRILAETRRWTLRDVRHNGHTRLPAWTHELLAHYPVNVLESWDDAEWEAFSLEALWRVCAEGVNAVPVKRLPLVKRVRHRDFLLASRGVDTDLLVHDLMIRYCAAFLDQGVSHWPLPGRDRGFYNSFLSIYSQTMSPPDSWMDRLPKECARLLSGSASAEECLTESLTLLGVQEDETEEFLGMTLLALRGWGGMVYQVEARGDRVALPVPQGTFVEFLAVRLLLDRIAACSVARDLAIVGPLSEMRARLAPAVNDATGPTLSQRVAPLFQLAQILGWTPPHLARLTPSEWAMILAEFDNFPEVERRRIFHRAYELRFRNRTLDAISLHPRRSIAVGQRPRFQIIFCLDEREESFRRHVEEVVPDAETLGSPGFFGVPMYFRGAAETHYVPLCPIVVTPNHYIEEEVAYDFDSAHRLRTKTRRILGQISHHFHIGTRSFALGAILTASLGILASIPLVGRILFPRLSSRIRSHFGQFIRTPLATHLKLERHVEPPGPELDARGFRVEEMAAMAEQFLRDIGLTRGFSRLVFIIGHGSDSLNNPHKSAYDCGACGGSPGAPNGRAMAAMLNDERIRTAIVSNGITIPDDTRFVGGVHNTCNDSIRLFDTANIPPTHQVELDFARNQFTEICRRNAHERCRRFMSASLNLSFVDAHLHVEARSEDLGQTRPELGHATNAICIISRRERTRGLFLDRRAFLNSYDPTQDDAAGSILLHILSAAIPVCCGINLEYYFSHVDSHGYGSGSKLPHNITALLGVMDGAASDLRTGLPWQMVEIHEPLRLLFVVETMPAVILGIMKTSKDFGTMVRNGWVQMAVLDPQSQAIQVYQDGRFVRYEPQTESLPSAASSADWYRGWRDHLDFAEIGD